MRDPDVILARLRSEQPQMLEEGAPKRGRLKIFFGYAAGIGKTYAMLEAARSAATGDRSVLLGFVEAHNRPETEAMLLGQEVLPRREIDYRGVRLQEFDLDAALGRKPDLILVDELAHTNAVGCRHTKRWHDIQELLSAGIDVWTTLNVQHIESLNDIVVQITGIVVRETIPDSVFDDADDVELIDLPPDDLLERLREGKVYMPEQARRAMERFFRKANLVALRELAMRRTADRVGNEVQTARFGRTRTQTWPTTERLLVCVGPSPTSAKVIRTAKRMASAMHAQWIALHMETASTGRLGDHDRHRLGQHLKLAATLGAETVTITGEDVAEEIVRYAQARNVTKIVIGKTGRTPRYLFWRRSVVDRLIAISGDIDVYVIRGVEEKTVPPPPTVETHLTWRGFVAATCVLAAVTALAMGFRAIGLTEPNIVMTYLLAVVSVATWFGHGPAIMSSILAVLLFNFFFTQPYHTFVVDDPQYVYTFIVMLVVAFTVSTLTARIRRQVTIAREREQQAEMHYRISQALAKTSGRLQLALVAQEQLGMIFGGEVVLFASDGDSLHPLTRKGKGFAASAAELETACWVFQHGQVAGRGTDTLPGSQAIYLPLPGTDMAVGVLGWRPRDDRDLSSIERRQLLDSFATQIALALERDLLTHEAQRILAEAETERVRSSLLSAVSHDLRTPLAAIAGSASALLDRQIDERTRDELARTIYEESDRLSRLVENLLHLTRIESGQIKIAKQLQPLDEVVGSALRRVESLLHAHSVATSVPVDLPLVPLDGLLIEQVLVNLLDNAAKYTPAGSQITVSARCVSGNVEVSVADRGPGLDEDERRRVFDKFYRGSHLSGDRGRGAGLGLTICRGIVKAHGGCIWAEAREEGGMRFIFTLPLGVAPQEGNTLKGGDGDG